MKGKNKSYKNFSTIILIVVGLIILIALFLVFPIGIFYLLSIGFENGAENSWSIGVGFYGSLLGGLGTIIAFLVSSYQTNKIQKENINLIKEQFYEDKRLNIKPYLNFYSEFKINYLKELKLFNNENIVLNKNRFVVTSKKNYDLANSEFYFKLKNIGLGPAINLNIVKFSFNEIELNLEECETNIEPLNIGGDLSFKVNIAYFDKCLRYGNFNNFNGDNKDEIIEKFKKTEIIYIDIAYNDLLYNKYLKKFCLELSFIPTVQYYKTDPKTNIKSYRLEDISYSIKLINEKCEEIFLKKD
ncbi:hypothetical protein ACV3P7_03120 [Clostridium perfringens]